MTFLTPYLLAGTLAGALPILVHLIHRERPKVVPFTLLKFVHQASQTTRRSWKLKNLFLLLLRILAVVLFAIALARPVWSRGILLTAATSASQAVIVIDDSYLMGVQSEDGETYLAKAKRHAAELIRGLPQGTALALVPAAQESLDFTIDQTSVLRALEVAEPSSRLPDCTLAVQRACEMFGESAEGAKDVYIFSDLSAGTWKQYSSVVDNLDARLIVIDVGEKRPPNVSVVKASPSSFSADRNTPIYVECSVHNHGMETTCSLELVFEGEKRAVREVQLSANATAHVSIPYEFAEAGLAQGKVRLVNEDSLTIDNERYFSVDVLEPVRTLVVTRDDKNDDAFFIRHALSPSGLRGRERAIPSEISQAELSAHELADTDVVLLVNLTRLSRENWDRLFKFVKAGGGIGIIAGDAMDLEHFSNVPEMPIDIVDVQREGKAFLSLSPRPHRLLDKFQLQGMNAIRMSSFQSWLNITPPDANNPMRVLATFGERMPALLERTLERGRVLFFSSSMDTSWNQLPKSFVFPPFVYEFVNYLSGREGMPSNYHPGDSLRIPLKLLESGAEIQVFEPYTDTPVTLVPEDGRDWAIHRIGERPGNAQVYIKIDDRNRKTGFSINIDVQPEHYPYIGKEGILKILPKATYVRPGEDISRNVAETTRGVEGTALVILLLLTVMCIESVVANRFYR